MKTDHQQAATDLQHLEDIFQHPLDMLELLVDADADGLKTASGRVFALFAGGHTVSDQRGQRGVDVDEINRFVADRPRRNTTGPTHEKRNSKTTLVNAVLATA